MFDIDTTVIIKYIIHSQYREKGGGGGREKRKSALKFI